MIIGQTPEQLLLREDAAISNPDFATLEGRALQDVRDTVAYLAVGLRPETVLGGLMLSHFGLFDSALLQENDRSAIEIAAGAGVNPIGPNVRGDTVTDVLEGLVNLGFAERVYIPDTIDALLLPDDDHHRVMDRPTYRLASQNLPPKVLRMLERVSSERAEYKDYDARRAARKAIPRSGLLRRRRSTQI